jgi:RHS repeat-associated protein
MSVFRQNISFVLPCLLGGFILRSFATITVTIERQNCILRQDVIPGTLTNYSQFTYDGLNHCVDIVETSGGTVTSTKQFVWCGDKMCEARNAAGGITSQYFKYGQTISGSNYYYSFDKPGSTREVTDSSGNMVAGYSYDPYGRAMKLQGSLDSDFRYAGYYFHSPSGLNVTLTRMYSSNLGRWISRDTVGEKGGINLYDYVTNNPVNFTDPSGRQSCDCPPGSGNCDGLRNGDSPNHCFGCGRGGICFQAGDGGLYSYVPPDLGTNCQWVYSPPPIRRR